MSCPPAGSSDGICMASARSCAPAPYFVTCNLLVHKTWLRQEKSMLDLEACLLCRMQQTAWTKGICKWGPHQQAEVDTAVCSEQGQRGVTRTVDWACMRLNIWPMSMMDCFVSRYTVPRKFSGMDSCAPTHRHHVSTQGPALACHDCKYAGAIS